jgi:hypothetical protein
VATRIPVRACQRAWAAQCACVFGVALLLFAGAAPAQAEPPLKKILVLDFQLIDEQKDYVAFPEAEARLAMVTQRLRDALVRDQLYQVVDNAPVAELIRAEVQRQNLLECNGCELDIARQAGADRVLLGWVQKVSNLILNINIEIRDAKSGKAVLTKSVDLRSNTDLSWQRGIDYLVRDMVERGQGNR